MTQTIVAAAARLAMGHLAARVGSQAIHIVGYSTGAPLAVNYTLDALATEGNPVPSSLILVSPAVSLHRAAALAGFKRRLSYVPGMGGLAWLQVLPEFDPFKYSSFPNDAGYLTHVLTTSVRSRLPEIDDRDDATRFPPVLTFMSLADATVMVEAVVEALDKVDMDEIAQRSRVEALVRKDRERVRSLLGRHPLVIEFHDAPPERGRVPGLIGVKAGRLTN